MKVDLTAAEIKAALEAIGQMTDGNARDFGEWKLSTSGTWAEWQALCRAERKLQNAIKEHLIRRARDIKEREEAFAMGALVAGLAGEPGLYKRPDRTA